MPPPLIFGHRGASHDAPENTLASLRAAWAQGADGVEFDVRLTADNRVVVFHDPTTRRLADKNLSVARHTLAELRALDVGRHKGPAWAGERIATIEDALATVPPGGRVLVELKAGPELLAPLARACAASGLPACDVILIAFEHDTLAAARPLLPGHPLLWIRGRGDSPKPGPRLLQRVRAAGFDGLDLDQRLDLTPAFTAAARADGLLLYAWTVNLPARARRLAELGFDGLATDRPGWLRAQLSAG